ncbi:AraC family transcriptional regulator [Pokkaliibacter sp. MBI-7]|uniref:AraC family transcriptional regulator n=1 Tax=Pokkaliibacter sp. MBI-7 TaxID=3040600 RepID=UPI00244D1C5C|nr:AraC family transcriptional regulator [Pokkaliibacter sp. MBI-7]MDH2432060.1 AraC family transcriptional regulator [Pokkaliibacter sp. MBI-7]
MTTARQPLDNCPFNTPTDGTTAAIETLTAESANIPACREDLVQLLQPLIRQEGFQSTAVDGVHVVSSIYGCQRNPMIYEPGIFIVAQGRKIGYLGENRYHYDPGNYLVQTLPLPFECETFASPQMPMMGLAVLIDPVMLSELVAQMGYSHHPEQADVEPMASVPMNASMHQAVLRLLQTLNDPLEARVLGSARVREVLYEVLRGPCSGALLQLLRQQGNFSRIVHVLSYLHRHYNQPLEIEQLAREANMSLSTFHLHFKNVTCSSPLQYLKRIRLLKARQLIMQGENNVSTAAMEVGYESPSQFSREYKRYFGAAPRSERVGA